MKGRKEEKVARGRPREFDEAAALERAMRVFWKKGYEGASLPDLTEAMGINRPSLYAAFGNKEQLFRKALARYTEHGGRMMDEALREPTARGFVERLLTRAAAGVTDGPGGCMVVQAALACGDEAEPIRKELASCRAKVETVVRKRFEAAKEAGELPADTDAAGLARYFAAVLHGMAVQSAGGTRRDDLREVVKVAMRAWPAC